MYAQIHLIKFLKVRKEKIKLCDWLLFLFIFFNSLLACVLDLVAFDGIK